MSTQVYLIDTNVLIGLEDNHTVQPILSEFISLANKHNIDVYVHEAASDDIKRDKDIDRRNISLSKLRKFQILSKVRKLTEGELESLFGPLQNPNDVVDATLLHALHIGASDFVVTEDTGLHRRARRHSPKISDRVLFVADAVQLLKTNFEPVETPVRYVSEVSAHSIPLTDEIFDSLREGYPDFNEWWRAKCVKERRSCWVVEDADDLAGIVVRKDETAENTDATADAEKILKISTFKVRPENRGIKLGELLLKKIFWFAQQNGYDLAYITTYKDQVALIALLEYYGFEHTNTKDDGELVYEKAFSQNNLKSVEHKDAYEVARMNYPRFLTTPFVQAFVIPIKEAYHDVLYPDLGLGTADDSSNMPTDGNGPRLPGNTIRKVYLCRAQSQLGPPGSLLFFYKGASRIEPSQAITAVGILEDVSRANSTGDLMRMTGGRSVYSETELSDWNASTARPVKVINYLLAGYVEPPVALDELLEEGVFRGRPPQSIARLQKRQRDFLLERLNPGFNT